MDESEVTTGGSSVGAEQLSAQSTTASASGSLNKLQMLE